MRPNNLTTKIFLDSGDPEETKSAIKLLGFLDGQTTNPTLLSKNPYAVERFKKGDKFTSQEIYDFYRQVVVEISGLIPEGSVSIEVYADPSTTAETMAEQGKLMNNWINNAHIKYPITSAGLSAANINVNDGQRVNMTLCFTQSQAAAVYAATHGTSKGGVFVSPFIGRLDDINKNGLKLIENITKMFAASDHHVEVLAASVRNQDHFMKCLKLGADIITAPYSVLKEWAEAGKPMPSPDLNINVANLKDIPYETLDLAQPWQSYNIDHPLTAKGIEKFSTDWNALIA